MQVLTPQQVCRHAPCWCGRDFRLPPGVQPYDSGVAAAWLVERERVRQENARVNADATQTE